ncbi:MAG: endoribonuclease [Firmicutes bacterium]|nr:endoribonuclease [Bacillota bacterium]
MKKEIINAKNAPAAVGPYVHAIKAGDFLFTSGQLGLDPVTGAMPEGVEAQTHLSLKNLGAILSEAGLSYQDVVKTTVFLQDMNDFATVNAIYADYFKGETPARSCVQVAKLPKGGLVEIEAVAVKSN